VRIIDASEKHSQTARLILKAWQPKVPVKRHLLLQSLQAHPASLLDLTHPRPPLRQTTALFASRQRGPRPVPALLPCPQLHSIPMQGMDALLFNGFAPATLTHGNAGPTLSEWYVPCQAGQSLPPFTQMTPTCPTTHVSVMRDRDAPWHSATGSGTAVIVFVSVPTTPPGTRAPAHGVMCVIKRVFGS